jgi:hypothetical protein
MIKEIIVCDNISHFNALNKKATDFYRNNHCYCSQWITPLTDSLNRIIFLVDDIIKPILSEHEISIIEQIDEINLIKEI